MEWRATMEPGVTQDALKENLLNHYRFMELVEGAHRRRSEQLLQLNAQIEEHEKELKDIDNGIATARLRLVDPESTAKAANFWMM
jgi:hypothetical protein